MVNIAWGCVLGFRNKKILFIAAVLVVCFAGLAAAISLTPITGTWRYKMTVEVETPEGLKTGSVVREVDVTLEPRPHSPYPYHSVVKVKGEAVAVDLGKRGVLFGLIDSDIFGVDYGYHVVYYVFPPLSGVAGPDSLRYYSALKTPTIILHPVFYPKFVRFTDPKDPKTVESVYDIGLCEKKNSDGTCDEQDPFANLTTMRDHLYVKGDHFEEMFGKGVKLKQVTIEMTNEPVTVGIEKWLTWLPSVKMSYLNGAHDSRNAPLGLDGGAFIRGDN